jgi:hypothetical protein
MLESTKESNTVLFRMNDLTDKIDYTSASDDELRRFVDCYKTRHRVVDIQDSETINALPISKCQMIQAYAKLPLTVPPPAAPVAPPAPPPPAVLPLPPSAARPQPRMEASMACKRWIWRKTLGLDALTEEALLDKLQSCCKIDALKHVQEGTKAPVEEYLRDFQAAQIGDAAQRKKTLTEIIIKRCLKLSRNTVPN